MARRRFHGGHVSVSSDSMGRSGHADIMAAHYWPDNGALIADVQGLGFIRGDVLDATFGLGKFWNRRVENLSITTNDLFKDADYQHDFTSFPEDWVDRYDSVIYDPPYKLNGTPTPSVDHRYGVDVPATLRQRLDLIVDGAIECLRVTKPGGNLLVKVQDQVASGRMHFQTDLVTQALDARKVAQLHFLTHPRPQPSRRQIHPRSNFSTLMVFRKG